MFLRAWHAHTYVCLCFCVRGVCIRMCVMLNELKYLGPDKASKAVKRPAPPT